MLLEGCSVANSRLILTSPPPNIKGKKKRKENQSWRKKKINACILLLVSLTEMLLLLDSALQNCTSSMFDLNFLCFTASKRYSWMVKICYSRRTCFTPKASLCNCKLIFAPHGHAWFLMHTLHHLWPLLITDCHILCGLLCAGPRDGWVCVQTLVWEMGPIRWH